jgi:O-antigen/teichoic acid export membrane protein
MSSQAEAAEFLKSPGACAPHSVAGSLNERGTIVHDRQFRDLATRSGVYLSLRYGLSIVVSMANMFLLTRWIGPHAYGVFVTAVGLTTFLASLTRFGVDTYLVRCEPAPDRQQYDVAFTLVLTNSFLLTGFGIAIVPLLKHWYANDEFAAPYLVMMLCVPLAGLAGIPVAKLERDLNFRSAATIELAGQVIALVVAAGLAWRGLSVWAPVTGMVAWQLFAFIAACAAARFSPGLKLEKQAARRMLAFGFGYSASMRMWQVRSLVNPLLVGRFVGAEGVALVAFALRVAEGIGFLRTAAGRLAIAALARLQSDRSQLRKALEKALELQLVILGPLLCTFALFGPWLVPRLMGTGWTGLLEVYPFVAIGVLLSSVFNLQASALFVVGEQWAVLRAYACHVGLLGLGTFLLLPRLGIVAYGWAEIVACAGYIFIHSALWKVVPLSYRALLPGLGVCVGILAISAMNISKTSIWLAAIIGLVAVAFGRAVGHKASTSFDGARHWLGARSTRRRVRTVLTKARLRGWRYVSSVARYEWGSWMYRGRRSSHQATEHDRTAGAHRSSNSNFIPTRAATKDSNFHFGPRDIPHIVGLVPLPVKMRAVEEADRILMHAFSFRGQQEVFKQAVNWTWCPDGNLSCQWDLNRHRFFLTLATAYYYTSDNRYMLKLIELWRDWIKTNPPGESDNWKYPFEVAARLQNWMWAYFLLAYSSPSTLVDMGELHHGLREHALHIYHHLEYHWPNNHLLLESKALYEFTLLFPELDPSGSFHRRGWRVLEREVKRQVLPDGAHSELCSMYHQIVAGELQELLLLCERQKHPLPEQLTSRIQRMSMFSQAMLRPDGSTPLLGDSAADDTYLRFDSARRDYSDLNYWLWRDLLESRDTGIFPKSADLQVFPHVGYAFLHNGGRAHVAFDVGAFSRCETSNHAHCDALSFELWANGERIVVDPGVYLPWHDHRDWTQYFRSTGAHNTVQIDGMEQSELADSLDHSHIARTRLLRYAKCSAYAAAVAECLPYRRSGDEVRHTREICLEADQMTIRDRVLGAGVHRLAWSFQFAPDVELTYKHKLLTGLSRQGRKLFALATHAPQQVQLKLFYGHKNPLRGWVSRDSSVVIRAPMACYSICAELPFEMESTFVF